MLPGALTQMMLGTDAALVRDAEPAEKARVHEILEHLLPVSARASGMALDVQAAAAPMPCPLDRIACPLLAISAEDDRFGTARRARSIAAQCLEGRAVIFPTGGHALVGRQGDALKAITLFLDAGSARAPRL
jgi:pimeloyl-ACP methyl ester carboxylesterase